MKRTLTAATLGLTLALASLTPAHASHWIDYIEPSSWVCRVAPVFC